MKLTREQVEQLSRTFEQNPDLQELEAEFDTMGRFRVFQIEMIQKRHPIKMNARMAKP